MFVEKKCLSAFIDLKGVLDMDPLRYHCGNLPTSLN